MSSQVLVVIALSLFIAARTFVNDLFWVILKSGLGGFAHFLCFLV